MQAFGIGTDTAAGRFNAIFPQQIRNAIALWLVSIDEASDVTIALVIPNTL